MVRMGFEYLKIELGQSIKKLRETTILNHRHTLLGVGLGFLFSLINFLVDEKSYIRDILISTIPLYFGFFSYVIDLYKKRLLKTEDFLKQTIASQKSAENDLAVSRDAALEAAAVKGRFLANMSHEIRTPMNGIIGTTQLLLNTKLTDEQKKMSNTIYSCGESLLNLIDDILDFSKIEAGNLKLESKPFDISLCIDETIKVVTPRALEKMVTIQFYIDPIVPKVIVGDYLRFRQVLLNLLSNAVKFTESGEVAIKVAVTQQAEDGLELIVSVRDSGAGIEEKQQESLFKTFSQVDASTTRIYGGTGLGLVICKNLCELMGGSIGFQSKRGVGSTFYFTLRTQAASDGAYPINSQKSNEFTNFSSLSKNYPLAIIVADDNSVNRELACSFLQNFGYKPDSVVNGVELLERLEQKNYEIVFMDGHMPEMDGYQATKIIREKIQKSHQPRIIAMTASVLPADRQRCLDVGMDDYLSKPFTVSKMAEVLINNFRGQPTGEATVLVQEQPLSLSVSKAANLKDQLISRFGSNRSVAVKMARIFLDDYQNYINDIEAALQNDDLKLLEYAAHSLKGSASNFGPNEVSEISEKIEKFAKNSQILNAQNIFPLLEQSAKNFDHELRQCEKELA